jgi:TolA-binding protein
MRTTLKAFTLAAAALATASTHALAQQDATVRTGASGQSTEAASLTNIRALYEQMINAVTGVVQIAQSRIVTNEERLEDLRRQINNIQTVVYRTETVYVDGYTPGDPGPGGDDGGGCG